MQAPTDAENQALVDRLQAEWERGTHSQAMLRDANTAHLCEIRRDLKRRANRAHAQALVEANAGQHARALWRQDEAQALKATGDALSLWLEGEGIRLDADTGPTETGPILLTEHAPPPGVCTAEPDATETTPRMRTSAELSERFYRALRAWRALPEWQQELTLSVLIGAGKQYQAAYANAKELGLQNLGERYARNTHAYDVALRVLCRAIGTEFQGASPVMLEELGLANPTQEDAP